MRRKFEGTGLGLSIVKGLLDMMHSRLEVDSEHERGSKFSFKLELPISDRLDDMYASSLPFDHKYLKLSPSEQETLIKRLRSLSYVVLNLEDFLLSKQIKHYLDQWGFNYRLTSKDKLKFECTKQHADIVILNDSLSYLEWFLNEFTQYYQKSEKAVREEFTKEKQQRVLFFSTIEGHQKAESLLMKYKPQSAVIVTKPAGPVKILTAITKATEPLFSKSDESFSLGNYGDIVKAQEEKKRLARDEYINFIKHSNNGNRFGTMDIGPGGELTISPSRLTPPAMFERIISGVNGEDKGRSNMQIETKDKDEKKKYNKNTQKDPKDISFLIVEDNKINEMILTTMLKQSGYYNYDIANNGLEAVEHFTKKSYDIIFMDLQMPICDGIVATKEIRKIERGEESHLISPPTPRSLDGTSMEEVHKIDGKRRKKAIIIAMTGLASNEDSQVAEAAGCNEFLTKPVSIKSLNARMESWTKEVLKAEEEAVLLAWEDYEESSSVGKHDNSK